jgi:acyl-CoA reductase-like NAD-dependent aldehyde dehydrogenase
MTTVSSMDCQLLSAGKRLRGGRAPIVVTDKFDGSPIATVAVPDAEQVRLTVHSSHEAWRRGVPPQGERADILERAAAGIERSRTEFVELITREAGFPASDGEAEVSRCIQTLRLSAAAARELAGEMIPLAGSATQSGKLGFTLRVPLGIVLAITPFNSPLNTVAHKVGPAFAAGNAVVLKPSSETPLTAARFADVLLESGMPEGLLSVLYGGAEVVSDLLQQPEIRYVAFTGSTATGAAIQAQAGLRRTQMELGSIAFTVLCQSADCSQALPKIVNAAFRKAGQVCTSVQTLLVHASLQEQVEEQLLELTAAIRFGDPRDPQTTTGPLINTASADRVESWIGEAISTGARRVTGGQRHRNVIAPTVLTDVSDRMSVVCKEVFGPVLNIRPFERLSQAIDLVNATPYGLATGIFTARLDEAFQSIRHLEVGSVYINDTSSSRVDRMPYGGMKESGFGREGPHSAVREMTEEKMILFSGANLV